MELSDEVRVTRLLTDEEQLAEMCEELDRRGAEVEFAVAQFVFANLSAKWEVTKEFALMRELNAAESRLIDLFMWGGPDRAMMGRAWSAYRHRLLYQTRMDG